MTSPGEIGDPRPAPRRLWRWMAGAAALGLVLAVGAGAVGLAVIRADAPPPPEPRVSAEVVDKEGRLLRPFAFPAGPGGLRARQRTGTRASSP